MTARLILLLCALCAAAPALVQAADFSFTGTFHRDDQVLLFDITLYSTASVTFRSLGYAGGTNAAGTAIPPGGFDTYFTWFSASDGTQIGANDNGPCASVGTRGGVCLDAWFSGKLGPGHYILALTQSGNLPNGTRTDGFSGEAAGNFTCASGFCDSFGGKDSGAWAIDILNVAFASLRPPRSGGAAGIRVAGAGSRWLGAACAHELAGNAFPGTPFRLFGIVPGPQSESKRDAV